MNPFGDFIKARRLSLGLGLREFCLMLNVDASNFSKIERGRIEPPSPSSALFRNLIDALRLTDEPEEVKKLTIAAELQRGQVPKSALSDEEVRAKLPAFFRTLSGSPVSDAEREELIEMIRNA
jgi:transcriptional regulator with XRE-family HTH domain